jgi:DNA primase
MARIGAEELESLKRSVSLERVVADHGVALTAQGDELLGLCPFHDDATPSFRVSPSKQVFHCFGCGAGGDVVAWVQQTRKVGFRRAVELLREFGGDLPSVTTAVAAGALPALITESTTDQEALDLVAGYYAERLGQTPDARAYAAERLISDEALTHFKIGVADRSLTYRVPSFTVKAGKVARETLTRVGLVRETGHEAFRGCLTFPITDENGHVVGLYGRKLSKPQHGAPVHLYLRGPHRGVFNLLGVRGQESIILCESIIDALTFWCAGFRHVTCTYGVEGLTAEIRDVLHSAKRVLLAFDRDDAGERGAEKVAAELMAAGVECRRVKFPHGMDANAYARKVSPAEKSLAVLLNAAEWMGGGALAPVSEEPRAASEKPADRGGPVLAAEAPVKTAPAVAAAAALTSTSTAAALAVPPPAEVAAHPPMKPTPTPVQAVGPVLLDNVAGLTLVSDDEVLLERGDRRYRVVGLRKNTSEDVMRVNVRVRTGSAFFMDTLDLQMSRPRDAFQKLAGTELGVSPDVIKHDVNALFEVLDELRRRRISAALTVEANPVPEMTDEERVDALRMLRNPKLLQQVLVDFERCGVVGEETNKLTGYLAAVSRKLERPLAVVLQSFSAAGKSSLMDGVLAFFPDEEEERFSAMTGQSLFYFGEKDLKHKILALAEEEGGEKVSYALKLLQSEGKLSIASTSKNNVTGVLETKRYKVEGPVMLFQTTTRVEMDEELLNRCLVLTVDESREQTQRIHAMQRRLRTEEGIVRNREKPSILRLHQNSQRLLEPWPVYNPYAEFMTFPTDKMRLRRDHMKYLTLIDAIALLHQFQREKRVILCDDGARVEALVVDLRDIEVANKLASEVLGRTLDELPPQTRRVLVEIRGMVLAAAEAEGCDPSEVRITRRDVREWMRCSEVQIRMHMQKLVEFEYLLPHRGQRGQQFVYELLWDGKGYEGDAFLAGLSTVKQISERHDLAMAERLRESVKGNGNGSVAALNGRHSTSAQTIGHGGGQGTSRVMNAQAETKE